MRKFSQSGHPELWLQKSQKKNTSRPVCVSGISDASVCDPSFQKNLTKNARKRYLTIIHNCTVIHRTEQRVTGNNGMQTLHIEEAAKSGLQRYCVFRKSKCRNSNCWLQSVDISNCPILSWPNLPSTYYLAITKNLGWESNPWRGLL
jgi:hypothetical protein